jgi:hypothetical protein
MISSKPLRNANREKPMRRIRKRFAMIVAVAAIGAADRAPAQTPAVGVQGFWKSGLATPLPRELRPAPPAVEPVRRAVHVERDRPQWLFPLVGGILGATVFAVTYECHDCFIGAAPWVAVGFGVGAAVGTVVEIGAG